MAERRIAVFGAGYIGLVTGACLAELGRQVAVRDINPERVRILNAGDVPIHEPGLGDMIARNKERLTFTEDLTEALTGAEIAYVCVDTPPSASGDADLSRVWAVVRSLADVRDLKAVVMKSTVPVEPGPAPAPCSTRSVWPTWATSPTPSSPPKAAPSRTSWPPTASSSDRTTTPPAPSSPPCTPALTPRWRPWT
ncbi:hypothetical protein [Streptomyces sp. NPDC005533]|uniref:hypothetical protein n=1 Tax=Streptomyces sp. NPDC005533 TaxID=3364723 RepID=UPI0036890A3D